MIRVSMVIDSVDLEVLSRKDFDDCDHCYIL